VHANISHLDCKGTSPTTVQQDIGSCGCKLLVTVSWRVCLCVCRRLWC